MAKSQNHTNHNQGFKLHRNGIKKPKKTLHKNIHGMDTVMKLAADGALGVILPDISKDTFFSSILRDRAFPRKTFSIQTERLITMF